VSAPGGAGTAVDVPGSDGPLGRLALARGTVDRATIKRQDAEWVARAWADPRTRVVAVENSEALVRSEGDRAELVFVPPPEAGEGPRFLLGIDDDGVVYFGVSGHITELPGTRRASPRQAGAMLSDRDAGLLTHAVALANWHGTHTHCPRCGAATVPAPAGHLTVCPVDGSEHFPRIDPAVIMLVTDPDDRILLARGAAWPERRMSVLAGFVEPGESAEQAVAREVREETDIVVGEISYLGSQPWPMPRSLMLGFRALAKGAQRITIDSDEILEARWFTRAELRASLESGELFVAPTSSIARRIIEFWYGAPLPVPPARTAPARLSRDFYTERALAHPAAQPPSPQGTPLVSAPAPGPRVSAPRSRRALRPHVPSPALPTARLSVRVAFPRGPRSARPRLPRLGTPRPASMIVGQKAPNEVHNDPRSWSGPFRRRLDRGLS